MVGFVIGLFIGGPILAAFCAAFGASLGIYKIL